jgi:hypothetical protein
VFPCNFHPSTTYTPLNIAQHQLLLHLLLIRRDLDRLILSTFCRLFDAFCWLRNPPVFHRPTSAQILVQGFWYKSIAIAHNQLRPPQLELPLRAIWPKVSQWRQVRVYLLYLAHVLANSRGDRRTSPLLSNNPFRNRVSSEPKSPAPPVQGGRPISTNPFLDSTEIGTTQTTAAPSTTVPNGRVSPEKKTFSENTIELFVRLADALFSRSLCLQPVSKTISS